MSTPSQDYGEPWDLMDTGATHDRNDNLVADKLAKMRFIACVNACAGMAAPAAEIQAMREAIKDAERILSYYRRFAPDLTDLPENIWLETIEGKRVVSALTKLQPFAKP